MIPEIKLTSKGAALLAKTPAGGAIPVTRWQIGTGFLPSGSSLDREALVMPLDDISIYDISESGNRATVLGQLLNQGRPEFVWEELGLWAQDPDEGEVLACYGNAFGAGEHIQAGTAQLREFIFGAVLIFDEVMTCFRLRFGGAAEYFGVTPDMVTYGKIIGAGMPVGAYGGRKEIMEMVAPSGPVYQAGTLSGNPIAMAAGLAQLKILWEDQDIYKRLFQKGEILFEGIRKIFTEKGIGYQVNAVSSLGSIFFTETPVTDYQSAKTSDTKAFSKYFEYMLEHGVHLAPSQFEAIFLSDAHTEEDIRQFLELINQYF